MTDQRKIQTDSYLMWLGGFVVAALVSGAGVVGVLVLIFLSFPIAAVCDIFFTPYLEALQSVSRTMSAIRRRRILWTVVPLILIALVVVPFVIGSGSGS